MFNFLNTTKTAEIKKNKNRCDFSYIKKSSEYLIPLRNSKRFKLIYRIIRRIKKKLRYTIPYPPEVLEKIRQKNMERKMIRFMFFSYRKKQKPYYFKLKLFYYRVLRLRKKQSTPTTMKEKIKKHYLKKLGRYIVTVLFLIDSG